MVIMNIYFESQFIFVNFYVKFFTHACLLIIIYMVFYILLGIQNYTMFSLKNRLFLTFQFGSIWGILGSQ